MKKMKPPFLALLAWAVLVSGAGAENYPHVPGGVQIDIPDRWSIDGDEDILEATSPDEQVGLIFIVLDESDLEAALDALDREISPLIPDFQPYGEAEEFVLNGMEAIGGEGAGTADGVPSEVGVLLVLTPTNKVVVALGIAEKSSFQYHQPTIETIFRSIRPL